MFKIGDKVKCVNAELLKGNDYAPNVKVGEEYEVKNIVEDNQGYQHLDVGLKSSLNYIRSYETQQELPEGDKIHWCHPSRFELI